MRYNPDIGMSETDFNIRWNILKHEAYLILPYIMRHSVGILMPEKKEDDVIPQGSGTCIQLGEHFFIATAAHVLEGFDDDDLWIVCSVKPTNVRPPILGTGSQGGGEYEPIDVAWIEVDRETALSTGKTFLTLDQLCVGVNHVGDDLVVLNGYPGGFTKEHHDTFVSAQSMSFIGATIVPSAWPESAFEELRCTQEDFFLLTFYPDEGNYLISGEPYRLPDPHGMSGGGLWRVPSNTEGIWSMDLSRLIGITLEWKDQDKWVKANQLQLWLQLVAEDFPDLADQINAYLNSSDS